MSIKRNVAYNIILSVSNVAFPIVTTPYISRVLGVENVGIVNFATTYALYFSSFAALGIPLYGIREIAKYNNDAKKRNKVFSELFFIICLSSVIFMFIYLVTILMVPVLFKNLEFLLITGISVFFVPLDSDWFFSGREKFKLITIRSLIAKIISIGGLFIFVRTRNDVVPYLILTLSANLISQFWNFGYMLKSEVKFCFKKLEIRKHFNSILILFTSRIAISIYTLLSPLLLGFMSDYAQVGYYTSAIKISKLVLAIVTSVSLVMIARINSIRGESNDQEQISGLVIRSFGFMMTLAIPATIGLIVIAPRFVPLFFGEEFIPSTISMQLLSLLIIVIGCSNLFGLQVLVSMGYEKKLLKAVLFGTVSNFCLNLLLIGPYGAMGASIASVAAEILVTVATIIFAKKVTIIRISGKSILQPVLAALPIIPVSLGLDSIMKHDISYLSATVIISTILYVAILALYFRNEQFCTILHSVVSRIKNDTARKQKNI